MKFKVIISNLKQPLEKTDILVKALKYAHDKNFLKDEAIKINEVRDYTELNQDWGIIFLKGGKKTVKDFCQFLKQNRIGKMETIENW